MDAVDRRRRPRPRAPTARSRARRPPRPGPARCPTRRRRSPPAFDPHAFTPAPRTFSAASVERPARPRRRVEPVGQPGGEALRPGPGDHRRIVGAQPAGRDDEARGRRSAQAAASAARTALLAATPPATTRRRRVADARARGAVRSTRQSTTACWKLAAMSSGRCSPLATARCTALLRPAKEKCGSPAADQRARQRHRLGIAVARPAPRSPGRRDSRGRAAWRSCRTLRPRHRRWSSRAGGSGRRPRTSSNWQWPPRASSSR